MELRINNPCGWSGQSFEMEYVLRQEGLNAVEAGVS